MTLYSEYLDDILIQCGGFGRYQIMLFTFIYMLGKICPAWTLLMMSVAGEMPVWSCSEKFEEKLVDMCVHGNGTRCTRFTYKDEHRTVVSQNHSVFCNVYFMLKDWNLVCDKAWITSFMTTIQMVGNLIGAFVGGHLSDAFGRKPALYLSIVLFTLFNFLAYISSSWQMFVVVRFVLGYACASFFVIYFPLLVEFMPAKQRAIISAFPSFTLWSALLGLIAWFFPDWDNLHLVTALSAVPMIDEAENIIKDMARINGRRVPDTSKIRYLIGPEKETRHYTMRDLFREKSLATATILLSCIWKSIPQRFSSKCLGASWRYINILS
ncbi:hypothetical protein KUTeg_010384 [Tegillarca granosa]|uniref:Major facilitator superfamily (MFS) profile domain-containing protein n=1 Tax=Tegillarca granosa TaxID=220873 RepID=A0ABQ9F6K0_TEGGR|nr:hypothetical protein KUTeg_010384 [Tegillarca granosa]